ncbi:hypothetical protein L6R53_01810 [Myxococcota bacterium]|nr:hypothetical protein [Myxococcota bacterium]
MLAPRATKAYLMVQQGIDPEGGEGEAVEGRGPGLWIALAVVAVLVLALLGWRVLAGGEPAAAPAPAEASASAPGAQVVQARPEGPTVTVITRPPGGRIFLDGADLGPAPAVVPVPTDAAPHELCVVDGDRRTCRQLTGAALALTDPYLFSVE